MMNAFSWMGILLGAVASTGAGEGRLFEEPFDYADGALTRVSADRWRHHSGDREEMLVTGGWVRLTQSGSEDVHILLEGQPYGTNSPVVFYVALDLIVEQPPQGLNGGYFAHFKDAANGFRGRLFATTNGAAAGQFRVGVASAAGNASGVAPRDLAPNTRYRIVLRYAVVTAIASLWIDPVSEDDPCVSSTDAGVPMAIAGLALRQSLSGGNGMGVLAIDHLAVALSFDALFSESPPPPPVMQPIVLSRISRALGMDLAQAGMLLEWEAVPAVVYTVWTAGEPEGEYHVLASGLTFAHGQASWFHALEPGDAQGFYRLSSP